MGTEGAGELELLVVAGERSFGRAVVDGLEAARTGVTATLLGPGADPVDRATASEADGLVVGSGVETPVAVVRRSTDEPGQPVVLLANAGDESTVDDALAAGAADVFPETAAERQCARIVDRIAALAEDGPDTTDDASGGPAADGTAADRSAGDTVTDERPYREVFENVSDGLVVHEPDTGEILDVNERFCEMNGYDRSELVGDDISLVTEPGEAYDEAAAQEKIAQARREGTQLFEWRNQRRDGETYPVEVHLAVVQLDGSERVLASVRDITERRALERTYQDVFESVSDGLVVHDPESGEIRDVNQQYCELTGYDQSELVGSNIRLVLPDDPEYGFERAVEYIERARETGPQLFEFEGQRKDGDRFVAEVSLTTVELRGEEQVLASVRDITERKRREREYEQIFDGVNDSIVIQDPETAQPLDANQSFLDRLGYESVAEIREGGFDELSATDAGYTREQARELCQRVIETGESETVEWQQETKAGDRRWIEATVDAAVIGGEERVLSIQRDVTERKRRERRLRLIADHLDEIIYLATADFSEILYINPAYEEIYGQPVAALAENPQAFVEAAHPADRDRYRADIEELVADIEGGDPEDIYEGQYRLQRDGETRWVDIGRFPIENEAGVVDRIVGRVQDITERERSEQRLRTIAERVDEIIYLANTDLTEVTYVNSAYADIYGRPTEELHEDPRAFIEAMHPEDREPYESELEAMLADIEAGDPDDRYEFDFRIQRPDGEVRWLDATGYPILDETDQPDQFVGVVKDVTERHQREQTLETFHEATRELTATDSQEAACRQAVQAAERVLGFPLVTAYLYSEESGALEPAAVAARLADLEGDPPSFGPGDSLPWQVFVEGEAVTRSEPTPPVYGPGVPGPDIVLPMGSHGVMLVGAPDEQFGAEEVELAQILAATLEAALNHVAGERALAEREAELQRQQARADQLEQLNTIIRDIEQATVEQSSRAGIEEAVCERLVDVDRHDVVWVAEPAVGDDGLVPRTSAGGAEGYVDGLTSVVGSAADPGGHPAVAAHRTGELHAVENVATDISGGEWRKHALGHGVQSVVAVPIRYETTTHGVLTVASADPDAFDEATRDVLAELGRSIGYAITVTEREQALESDGTTELEFDVADEGLFMIRGATTADCRVALERTIRRTGGSFSMFYTVEGAEPAAVVDLADAAPSVATAQVVSSNEAEAGGLVEVTAPTWFGSVFTEHGAVVREATATPDGGTLLVEAPRGTDVRALVEGFQERYPDAELVAQRQRDRTIRSLFELQDALETELTDRQWEALETAYSAGYFSWPRETSGQEVAELLGVSQPTFNKHLRIAERSAFRMLLDREYPADDE